MIMIEEDASRVFCQMTFGIRVKYMESQIKCKGMNCAAWQWVTERWENEKPANTNEDAGYCGMAGIPLCNLDRHLIDPQSP